jgi:acylphosphatase
MTRLFVRYEGRVQGVGFRATVAYIARRFPVTGRVCNVVDGSVELLAEGDRQELIRFRDEIRAELERYIQRAAETWSDDVSGWTDFQIAPDKY